MVIVTTAVYWGLNSQLRSQRLLTGPLNLPAPGRRQSIYINLTSSHGPVFLINSRFPLFSATPQRFQSQRPSRRKAPLLPKLRGHFAEFLNHSSPERLSIFNLTTCVGLGYGPYTHIARGFSRQYRITTINPLGVYASRLNHNVRRICLPHGLHAYTTNPISGVATSLRHPIT